MNIFVLDYDPKKCSQYHCDAHVRKMILETAQLLCSVHHIFNTGLEIPYKLTHKNHPCSIWARESRENYLWLCLLGINLSTEFIYRFNKAHASQEVILWCYQNVPFKNDGCLTPFARCVGAYNTDPNEDVVQVYRRYYYFEKCLGIRFHYTKREVPEWLKEFYGVC